MDEQVKIFPAIKARLLCEYEKDDWPVIDQAIKDLPDDSLIITVGADGFICKMGDSKPNIYPAKVYVVSSIDSAYSVKSLKQIGSLHHRAEALTQKILSLNESKSILLPEEIVIELKALITDAKSAAVEPISRYRILMNFIAKCLKLGMSFRNPFNTYTMDINNCHLIAGREVDANE